MRHSQCIWLIPPKSRTVDLDAANALDFRNLCVDLPVVIAGRDSELIALGTGEDADHGAGRRDGRDAGDDLFTDMRLFTFQNPNVPLGGGAVEVRVSLPSTPVRSRQLLRSPPIWWAMLSVSFCSP